MTHAPWFWMWAGTLSGVAAYLQWPHAYRGWMGLLAACLLSGALLKTRRSFCMVCFFGLWMVLAWTSTHWHTEKHNQWLEQITPSLGQTLVVDGQVVHHPILHPDHGLVKIRVAEAQGMPMLEGQPIWLRMQTWQYPSRGDQIRVRGRLHLHQWLKQDRLRINIGSDENWALLTSPSRPWQTVSEKVKHTIAQHTSGTAWMIHRALSMGEGQGLPAAIKQQFVEMGIIHLFVFSGFHVGLLFVLFAWWGRCFLRCLAFIWPHRCLKHGVAPLALLMTFGYVWLLVQWSLPTMRAMAFLLLGWVVYKSGRRMNPLPWICFALTGCLLFDPWLIQSPSALLSFSAVTGIVWTLQLTQPKLPAGNRLQKIKKVMGQNFYVALSAFVWTAPILLYFFQRVNLMSTVYNFLLVPTLGCALIAIAIFNNVWTLLFQGAMGLQYSIWVQEKLTFWFLDIAGLLQQAALWTVSIDNIRVWWVVSFYGCLIISYLAVTWQKKKQIKQPRFL
jgi:ComEC/Rec2-related protein